MRVHMCIDTNHLLFVHFFCDIHGRFAFYPPPVACSWASQRDNENLRTYKTNCNWKWFQQLNWIAFHLQDSHKKTEWRPIDRWARSLWVTHRDRMRINCYWFYLQFTKQIMEFHLICYPLMDEIDRVINFCSICWLYGATNQ